MRVYRDDQKFLTFRINALLWAIVVVFVFLAGSFWVVQGVQAEKYRNLSEANALREIVTPGQARPDHRPHRPEDPGRQPARLLADARPRDHAADREGRSGAPRRRWSPSSRSVLGVPPQEIEARFEKGKAIPNARPIPIAEDLIMPQVASIQAQAVAFPELNVEPVQRRNYPYAHDGRAHHGLHRRGQREGPGARTRTSSRAISSASAAWR